MKLTLRDYLSLPDNMTPKWVHQTWDAHSDQEDVLLKVTIDATHSGRITNNRVYPGTRMRDGTSTWLEPYPKPVLKHHNREQDALGRIIDAKYMALLKGDAFKFDYKRPDINGPGSGFIRLTANITDHDAAGKFLDKRFDTVSTSQYSDGLTCSICDKPLISPIMRFFGEGDDDEDPCMHIPGKVYKIEEDDLSDYKKKKKKTKDVLCYGITGKLEYFEVSPVNIPADAFARVLKTDSFTQDDLAAIGIKDQESLFLPAWCGETVVGNFRIQDSAGNDMPTIDKNIYSVGNLPDNVYDGSNKSTEDPEQSLIELAILDELTEQEADDLYGIMAKELPEDAKLSAAQRKKLAGKTFCAPKSRAFPVPDCAHVTSALRLLSRYKGSENKASIRACILRKQRSLQCKGAKQKGDAERSLETLLSMANDGYSLDELMANDFAIDILSAFDSSGGCGSQTNSSTDKQKDDVSRSPKMTENKTNQSVEIPVEQLQDTLKSLTQSQKDLELKLKDQVTTLSAKEDLIKDRDTQISNLHKQLEDRAKESAIALSHALTTSYVILKRPQARTIKDKSSLQQVVDELSTRTVESLRDALCDALVEIVETLELGKSKDDVSKKGKDVKAVDVLKDDGVDPKSKIQEDGSKNGTVDDFDNIMSRYNFSNL